MLSSGASLGSVALRCALSGASIASSFELRSLTRLPRQGQCFFHTQPQTVTSCRIPNPVVPEAYGDVQLREGLSAVDGPAPGKSYLVVLGPPHTGSVVSSKAVANELCHLRPFLLEYGGGVSITSSIPSVLAQARFCTSVFREAHALALTTCLQTTAQGAAAADLDAVLAHTDVVGLDLKPLHCPSDLFNRNKEWALDELVHLSSRLQQLNIPYFLRYVLIPGATDQAHDIATLLDVAGFLKPHLQGVQLLPYHVLSGERWHRMGFGQLPKGQMQPFKIELVEKLAQRMSELGFNVSLQLKPS